MSNKEEIKKMVNGELTIDEAEQLYKKLHNRSERQIIDDLKELEFESLLNTQDCIESGIENNPELNTNEVRKSLGYLYQAIKERCNELISAEAKLKEMLR